MKPQWEYRVVLKYGADDNNIESTLNDLGKDGWEGWGIDRYASSRLIYLKRPRRDPQ